MWWCCLPRCSNADPNYGMMWFHCRDMPSDTPRLLMRRAKLILSKDLAALYPLYLQAITRRITVEQQVVAATSSKDGEAGSKAVQKALREAEAVAGVAGLQLEPWDFVTGLVGLNRIASRISDLPDEDKRKMLFGCVAQQTNRPRPGVMSEGLTERAVCGACCRSDQLVP